MDIPGLKLMVTPTSCPGPFPITFYVRAEAWFYDVKYLLKSPHNFVEFKVVIVPGTSCQGQALSTSSSLPFFRDEFYSDIDAPVGLFSQYFSKLSMQYPLYTLSNMGGA